MHCNRVRSRRTGSRNGGWPRSRDHHVLSKNPSFRLMASTGMQATVPCSCGVSLTPVPIGFGGVPCVPGVPVIP